MATVTRPSESLPVAGGDMTAEPITNYINNILTFLEANNIDENNVDYSSTDGIATLDQTQTFTGAKTFSTTTAWAADTIVSGLRIRHDPSSGTANDTMGIELLFQGDNDASTPETIDYVSLQAKFLDTSDGTEEGGLTVRLITGGTEVDSIDITDGTMSFRGAQTLDTSGNNNLTLNVGTADVLLTASNLAPATDDGVALGVAGTNGFSDLFLASGGVISWENGDVTITHSSDTLTFAGGTIVVPGTYSAPLRIGALRLWYDATDGVLRVKHAADPSNEQDGNMLMEG